MYMRSNQTSDRRRELVVPPSYGGTAVGKTRDRERLSPSYPPQKEHRAETVTPMPSSLKASPTAAGLLLPRYDSDSGGGLDRLADRDEGDRDRRQRAFRKPNALLPRDEEEALPAFVEPKAAMTVSSAGGVGGTLKKLFSDLELDETTLVALLLLLLGMGEEKGTPLVLLGLLLLLG